VEAVNTADDAEEYLRRNHPGQADLALWVRSVLLQAEPDLEQRVYPGWQAVGFHDPEAGYVCGLFPRSPALLLSFEHGARLEDPEHLLEGTGKQVRSFPVHGRDLRTEARIRELFGRAVNDALAHKAGSPAFRSAGRHAPY
jgi:hypothetical protein